MRGILIVLLIFMIWRTLVKYVLPELARGAINNMNEKMRREYERRQQQQQNNDPTPKVEHKQNEPKPLQGGEYIDYEEVK